MAIGFLIGPATGRHEGQQFFANQELREDAFDIRETLETPEDSVTSVAQSLDVLAGSVVRHATFTVTARAPGGASIRSVAQVRAAAGNPEDAAKELIVDFQGLRTVSRVTAPALMLEILPWVGTQYGALSLASSRGETELDFREALAERLLVKFTTPVDPAALAAGGSVTIPTPPADLELTVNGVRAWFNAGPARPAAPQKGEEDAEPEFRAELDLTAAIRAAVEAGAVPIRVELRSSIPGRLALAARLDTLKTHTVVFPEGTRALDAPAEGDFRLAVPLPTEASSWMIHAVEATISGSLGAMRVRPDGPPLSTDAELVLDVNRSAVVRLPGNEVGRLAKLTALRLPVVAGADGAEISGTLLADLDCEPGEPVTDGQLGPVQIPPAPDRMVWITLPFAPAREPEPLWVSVQAARGSILWPLAEPQVDPDAPPECGEGPDPRLNALVRRRAPNGRFKRLSEVEGVETGAAALRVAGEPPPNAPIPPAEIRVVGEAAAVQFTPSTEGVTVSLRLAAPVATGSEPAFERGALQLELLTWTPGTFSFRDVQIAYTEKEDDQ